MAAAAGEVKTGAAGEPMMLWPTGTTAMHCERWGRNKSHDEYDSQLAAAIAASEGEAAERWADVPIDGDDRADGGEESDEDPRWVDSDDGDAAAIPRRAIPWTYTDSSSDGGDDVSDDTEDDEEPASRGECDRCGRQWKWAASLPTCQQCRETPQGRDDAAPGRLRPLPEEKGFELTDGCLYPDLPRHLYGYSSCGYSANNMVIHLYGYSENSYGYNRIIGDTKSYGYTHINLYGYSFVFG